MQRYLFDWHISGNIAVNYPHVHIVMLFLTVIADNWVFMSSNPVQGIYSEACTKNSLSVIHAKDQSSNLGRDIQFTFIIIERKLNFQYFGICQTKNAFDQR